MENKTEFVLTTAKGGKVAEKIINAGVNINFDNGIINIMGQRAVATLMEKDEITSLPSYYNIRMNEQSQIVMPNESDEQKAKREANLAIFNELSEAIKNATETAIGKLNSLHNAQ